MDGTFSFFVLPIGVAVVRTLNSGSRYCCTDSRVQNGILRSTTRSRRAAVRRKFGRCGDGMLVGHASRLAPRAPNARYGRRSDFPSENGHAPRRNRFAVQPCDCYNLNMMKAPPSRSKAGPNWIKRRQWQREAAVRARRNGSPVTDIAKRFDVSQETVYAWLRAAKQAGGSPPPPRRPGRVAKSPLERAALARAIQRHVARATEEDRMTSALADWLERRHGIQYAESTVRRLLWRVGCTCSTNLVSGAAVLIWSYPLPERPEWLTPERLRRIEELVREGVSPRYAARPLTKGALLEHMATMKHAMKNAGALEDDLVRVLFGEGIIEHPISKALVFERDVSPAIKPMPSQSA